MSVTLIQIKNEVVEWLQERLDIDYAEALELAQEFAGVLYFSGAFIAPGEEADPPPDAASVTPVKVPGAGARWG